MNSIKSCIHSEEFLPSDRRWTRERLWSFCRAVWNFIGEVMRMVREWNWEETGDDGSLNVGSSFCTRNHSFAPSIIIRTGMVSGSKNERSFKRLLRSPDSSFNFSNWRENLAAPDRSS